MRIADMKASVRRFGSFYRSCRARHCCRRTRAVVDPLIRQRSDHRLSLCAHLPSLLCLQAPPPRAPHAATPCEAPRYVPRARVDAAPPPYAPSPPWRALPRPSSAPQPASPSRRQARHRQLRATPSLDGAPRAPLAARSLHPTRRDAVGHGQRLRWPHAPTRGTTRCGLRGAPQGRPCARDALASRSWRANRRRSL